jgi:phosphoribosylglycinamide formyltransferase 2
MSSSGKGQSTIKTEADIEKAWAYAMEGGRGDYQEVIVEAFIKFDYEITVLTVTQKRGSTLFCPPIGHRQERGDYMESWQPAPMAEKHLREAQQMAEKITKALTGFGIWGVEFFIAPDGVYFSELSPRPHDTGMVTLAGTQNFSEFELHARAFLGLPIPEITLERAGASAVVLASKESKNPMVTGIERAANYKKSDFRIFGKPSSRPFRRMGVALAYDKPGTDVVGLVTYAKQVASEIKVD